ncbi:MAG: DNA integrity scanning protein DisA nucleotide-binding domain protein [Thermoplasmatota archaeon]
MEDLIARTLAAREGFQATRLLLVGGDMEDLRAMIAALEGPLLVASHHPALGELVDEDREVEVLELGFRVGGGIDALKVLRDVVLTAYVAGRIDPEERLLVVSLGDEAGHALLAFDMAQDESVAKLKKDLEYRADVKVVEAVMAIARDLAREGREKNPVGTVFVVGDTDRVLRHSRQVVLNPFAGHPPQDRNVVDPRTWETIKEFAQIDGAIVVREDGIVEAAGRYIEVRDPTDLPSGLGGRHLAAAAISTESKAIAVTVSESGVVRIFRDGRILLRIGVT